MSWTAELSPVRSVLFVLGLQVLMLDRVAGGGTTGGGTPGRLEGRKDPAAVYDVPLYSDCRFVHL